VYCSAQYPRRNADMSDVPIEQAVSAKRTLERPLSRKFLSLSPVTADGRTLCVIEDSLFLVHRTTISKLASKARLPTMYGLRQCVDAAELMFYGPSRGDLLRRSAGYVDKILKGAKPGGLPIEQPTQFELVINLKTARALGITIPDSILLRADEVIR
jgi:putative ABC transport system substrate-binding protein